MTEIDETEVEVQITLNDEQKQKVNEELKKALGVYRSNIMMMSLDVPISALCLSKKVEQILARHNVHRLYDLINRDLTEIEGISSDTARNLTTSLDQFLSMTV